MYKTYTTSSGLITVCLMMAVAADPAHDLYKHLLDGYDRRIRPRRNFSQPVDVTMAFELIQIINLEEKLQVLETAGFFVAQWDDDYLKWDPKKYDDIEVLVLAPNIIWVPDFGIENSADTFYHEYFLKYFHARVRYDGHVQWSFGGDISTLCSLDMTVFPFDIQTCEINIENWAYSGTEVALTNKTDHVDTDAYLPNGVWNIVKTKVELINHKYVATGDILFPEVKFIMYLGRKEKFFMLNLVLPCSFIVLVALGVYWVPADSGEKVSLGITVLLAFSVFQLVLQDQIPVNSDNTPMIGTLVTTIMGLSSVTVMTSILVTYLTHRDCHHPVPSCIRTVAFKGLRTILCMRKSVSEVSDAEKVKPKSNMDLIIENMEEADWKKRGRNVKDEQGSSTELRQMAACLEYMSSRTKEKDAAATMKDQWRELARIIDRLMFWLSVMVIIILFTMFLIHGGTSHVDDPDATHVNI